MLLAAAFGKPSLGAAASIGAFITGFTSLQGVYRTRLRAVLIAAFGMSLTSFIGALAAHSTPGLIAATAVAAYACATIGQIGPVAATAAINSFVAFVLFSSQALEPSMALEQSGLVLGGGLVQALLVLVVWPTARLDVERAALADVYRRLAQYAREVAAGYSIAPPFTPFATARQILADPQPFARSAEMARLARLLEDSEMIRKQLAALVTSHVVPAEVATQLDAIADELTGKPAAPMTSNADPSIPLELAAQLRDARLAAAMVAGRPLPNLQLLSKPKPGPYVENHIDWFGRDALRFAAVLAIAMALGRHFSADRGYWIPMTAAIVLKPDFQTTFVRGFGRIAGTLVGAVVATLVLTLVRGHPTLQLAGVLVTAGAAYLTFNPNYALFTVAITSFVVLVLALRGMAGTITIDARILDTLAGGALAMLGFLALPSWERKRTRALLADLLDAQRALSDAILRAYVAPADYSHDAIERARTNVWRVRTEVEASVDRTRSEPKSPHSIGAGRALRILSATQRYALASLALESALNSPIQRPPTDALAAFADALDIRMAELASALRLAQRAPRDDRLTAAAAAFAGEHDFFSDRLRAYVDATARIAKLSS